VVIPTVVEIKDYLKRLFTGKTKHRGAVAIIILAVLSVFAVGVNKKRYSRISFPPRDAPASLRAGYLE
jgi:hypothetical protein